MNLFLVRHGEIPANVKKVYAGRSAERLTDKGIHQAEEVAEKLKSCNVHSIYSSPIQRALQTAEIIREKIKADFFIESAFREMELGPWEGLSENDVARMYPREWSIWQSRPAELKLPGRETLGELLERVLTGVQNIYRDRTSRNIVVVTHVAVIRVLLLWHAKKELNLYKTIHVPNAGVFEIGIDTCP
ncbi:MAG TPA: histidine phosphatase family protein [Nitrospirae bacterium]|nr:putative phosphoserine phosphatase 2 [bacterium BMS3Abin06]HDH12743.1 histidine phosphatase family protein [Nitrospirota bacterium]HDZ00052.1 histidine phosphatase family protein [Nitrospirota bacterium]